MIVYKFLTLIHFVCLFSKIFPVSGSEYSDVSPSWECHEKLSSVRGKEGKVLYPFTTTPVHLPTNTSCFRLPVLTSV